MGFLIGWFGGVTMAGGRRAAASTSFEAGKEFLEDSATASHATFPASPPIGPCSLEQVPEVEVDIDGVRSPRAPATAPRAACGKTLTAGLDVNLVTNPVVNRPFLRLAQNVVGGLNLLEFGLRCFVVGVGIGVVLLGQGPIGFLDLISRGGTIHPQDSIVIRRHALSFPCVGVETEPEWSYSDGSPARELRGHIRGQHQAHHAEL